MTTMRDVAKLAGVSAKTVSRVFNDDPHVTDETRQRVRWAMTELKYVPNMLARSFRAGSDAAIGIAVPDIADPFFANMTRSIESVALVEGMAVVVTSLTSNPARERPNVEALLRRQITGLILAPVAHDQSYLSHWQERTPIVFVDRAPTKLSASFVVEDDYGGAFDAVTHLAKHGHRAIAFVGDSVEIPTTRRRLDGYRNALAGAGLTLNDDHVCLIDSSRSDGVSAAVDLLSLPTAPTAYFSSNARCTMALVPALQAAGRTDVGLVGFGDFPMAAALSPPVSVIDQDPESVGRNAVERLLERLREPKKRLKNKTVLPVTLIPRGSGELAPSVRSASERS